MLKMSVEVALKRDRFVISQRDTRVVISLTHGFRYSEVIQFDGLSASRPCDPDLRAMSWALYGQMKAKDS